MADLIGRRVPLGMIKKPSVSSVNGSAMGARAKAELIQKLAGNTRHLLEYTTGALVSGQRPCAPLSPHTRLPGHDHSGGMYGAPIQRNLWSVAYGKEHQTGAPPDPVEDGDAPKVAIIATDTADDPAALLRADIRTLWIPMCAEDGAHKSAFLYFRLNSSANVFDFVATWTVEGQTNTMSKTLVSSGFSDHTFGVDAGTNPVHIVPGKLNFARFNIDLAFNTGNTTVSIISAALYISQDDP